MKVVLVGIVTYKYIRSKHLGGAELFVLKYQLAQEQMQVQTHHEKKQNFERELEGHIDQIFTRAVRIRITLY